MTQYMTGRMQGTIYKPRLLSHYSRFSLAQMLDEQSLQIRGKHKFKTKFIDLLFLVDTDDEKQMDQYEQNVKNATNLDIPDFLVKQLT